MRARRRVALLVETSNAYARGLLGGVAAYVRENGPWSIHLPEQHRGARPPAWLRGWKGDGIIARIETDAIAQAVRRAGVPTVDLSAARLVPELPWVETDDRAIAQAAAAHLLERGFRTFAYCGEGRFNWSRWREEAFRAAVEAAGGACHVFPGSNARSADGLPPGGVDSARRRRRLQEWLTALPKPIGVFACYDILGQQVLDACREAGIAVPEEAAVLGVDDDRLLCELCDPPLSSVAPDAARAGYEAARMLDLLLRGETPALPAVLVPPLGVSTRQSTDVLATDDAEAAKALRHLREHACEGITVADLLKVIPLSRRVLEFRFRKSFGKTPHAFLVQYRLERAKELLRETDLPLVRIAGSSGFSYVEYMNMVFRKQLGQTPGEYRRLTRGGNG